MKKLIYGSLLLASITFNFTSCEKEQIQKTSVETTDIVVEKIDKPKLSNIACVGTDPSGESCAGTRCNTAPGSDCRVASSTCKCTSASKNFKFPDGMTLEEFNETWTTESGKAYLESLGYSQRDVE